MKVDICVIDRNSPIMANENNFEFQTFVELKEKVDEFVKSLPFYKVIVEITPVDFLPTPTQKEEIHKIEEL